MQVVHQNLEPWGNSNLKKKLVTHTHTYIHTQCNKHDQGFAKWGRTMKSNKQTKTQNGDAQCNQKNKQTKTQSNQTNKRKHTFSDPSFHYYIDRYLVVILGLYYLSSFIPAHQNLARDTVITKAGFYIHLE